MTRVFFVSLLLFMGLTACQNDGTSSSGDSLEDQLLGSWEIVQAIRDGQPTSTLNELYMEFSADGRMISNLGGAREESDYEVNGQVISQQGNRLSLDYTVESISDSTLVLKMTMRETPFRFTFQRVEDAE